MSRSALLAFERCLVSLVLGVLALMLLVNLVGVMAEWRISESERPLLGIFGRWYFSLYSAVLGATVIGLPIGFVCGFVCGKLPPTYGVVAAAVLIGPFLLMDPLDPSVYAPSALTAGAFTIASTFGALLRLKRGPSSFSLVTAREASARQVAALDVGLAVALLSVIMCAQSALSNGSFAPAAGSWVLACVLLAFLRSRVKLRTESSVA